MSNVEQQQAAAQNEELPVILGKTAQSEEKSKVEVSADEAV